MNHHFSITFESYEIDLLCLTWKRDHHGDHHGHFHVDGVKPGKILIHIEGIVVVKDLLLCLENLLSFLKNGILVVVWSSIPRTRIDRR